MGAPSGFASWLLAASAATSSSRLPRVGGSLWTCCIRSSLSTTTKRWASAPRNTVPVSRGARLRSGAAALGDALPIVVNKMHSHPHSQEPGVKTCTQCHESKPATAVFFARDVTRKSGLHPWCRACISKRGKEKRAPFARPRPNLSDLSANVVITDAGCWEWRYLVNDQGYGVMTVDSRRRRAHRYYYERLVAPIPRGRLLHHRCENRRCVNPDHLEPLLPSHHMAVAPSAKLTWAAVEEIRRRHAAGEGQSALSREFGVSSSIVCRVVNGKAWRT